MAFRYIFGFSELALRCNFGFAELAFSIIPIRTCVPKQQSKPMFAHIAIPTEIREFGNSKLRSKIAVQTYVRNFTDRNLCCTIPYAYVAYNKWLPGWFLRIVVAHNIYGCRLGFSRYSGDYSYVDSDWQGLMS
jgi:hypothetical protein